MNPKEVRGEIVYRRTYSRPLMLDETTFETWNETVDRVIEHQRWLWERALTHKILRGMQLRDITEDMYEWVTLNEEQELELEELRNIIYERKGIVSGRQMWLGGTEVGKKHESSLFNCSFAEARTIYDMVDLFWLLLNGCGVGIKPIEGTLTGFRTTIKELEIIRSKRLPHEKGRETNEESVEDNTWYISIGDSAQSWAKSIGKLLAGKYKVNKLVIDLSEIRGAGYRLKGYGWISSGDMQLSKALPKIFNILNNRAGSILTKLDIIEIIDLLGSVLSSRRSAIITFVDYGSSQWYDFSKFKENCYEPEYAHRQQSNNSLMFWNKPTKEELSKIFDIMIESGGSEPGFINAENMKKRAPFASGLNPCAEILLSSHSFCNLVEIPVSKYKDNMPGLYKTIELLARANYRQTCVDLEDGILQETWNLNQAFTRLCGTSLTGITEREDLTEYDLKNMRYCAVSAARSMAKELDTPFPKNVSTLKPSGTVSKLMATTEGIHKPLGKYIFNWINFSKHDPLIERLKQANYRTLENPSDETSILVCFPIKWDNIEFTKVSVERKNGNKEILEVNKESAVEQLERYKFYMRNWCDQNVSNTISYDIEEKESIIDWILENWNDYVGVSFLFRADPTMSAQDLGFNYLPQEVVTKEKYDSYIKELVDINFEDTGTFEEIESLECSNGVCPIK